MSEKLHGLVKAVAENEADTGRDKGLAITYPFDGALFPPEIAAPVFTWIEQTLVSKQWLVVVEFNERRGPIYAQTNVPRWTPNRVTWEAIKMGSKQQNAKITVYGFDNKTAPRLTAWDSIRLSTAEDRVDAAVLYRQVQLPFQVGEENFRKIRWRLGDITSYDSAPVIMEDIPVCASCHLVTKDGTAISMEMNYKGDSGAHLISQVEKKIKVSDEDFMTWTAVPKPEILPRTRGLFAKISPSGKYLMSTVHEISYAAVTNDLAFSQLFFPTYGVLAWYSIENKTFNLLPGADDDSFVQTDPCWRDDEQYIVFARSPTKNEYHKDITKIRTQIENADIHALNKRFPIQFDLYQIPFNQGKGGTPEPLNGASHNGMSNYFPRYSPDGRWIVFTRSETGIMLQPDSELYIIPAAGGEARRLVCNRSLLNSWHSFSPNGKWMLFSSKTNTPFTEIFLTHIDENGFDSPPVCLSRFSDEHYAANVPEFVNLESGAIASITIEDHR